MKISKLRVGLTLFIILTGLLMAHLLLVLFDRQDSELLSLFRMDFEGSLFTWFSQVVLLFIPALLTFYIGYGKQKAGAKYALHWYILGCLLVFLSIDDGAMIHEKFSRISEIIGLQSVLDSINAALFSWSWWVIYLAIVIVIGYFCINWVLKLPKRTKILFALAIILMLIGQVGLEAVTSYLNAAGNYDIILRGFEKLIGRFGLIVLIYTLLDYIQFLPQKELPTIKLEITE
jgi:hypothetical protein